MGELHFNVYECYCKQEWQPVFSVGEDGLLEHPLVVKMITNKEFLYLDLLYNDVVQLRFSLKQAVGAEDPLTNTLYKTDLVYVHPDWVLKSFEFHALLMKPVSAIGELSLAFIDAQYEKLFGVEIKPTGLTGAPARQEDTVH